MKLIAITPEAYFPQEIDFILTILDNGFDYVHIRKPQSDLETVDNFVSRIPPEYYCRLKIHNHFEVAEKYNLGGIHLNAKHPTIPDCYTGKISRSCHSFEELKDISRFEYGFLSPIFNSICKKGYLSNFTDKELREARDKGLVTPKVVALGGITAAKLPYLSTIGFGGAAFLGYLFNAEDIQQLTTILNEIKKTI